MGHYFVSYQFKLLISLCTLHYLCQVLDTILFVCTTCLVFHGTFRILVNMDIFLRVFQARYELICIFNSQCICMEDCKMLFTYLFLIDMTILHVIFLCPFFVIPLLILLISFIMTKIKLKFM